MDAVKAILKSIVISCPGQVTVLQLQNDYREIEGRPLPYRNLGFDSPERMLRAFTDVIKICGNGPRAVVLPVNNEKTEHISRFVTEQKQTRKKPIRFQQRNAKYENRYDHRHYQSKDFSYIRSKPKHQYNFQNVRKYTPNAKKFPSMAIVKEEATSHTKISNFKDTSESNGQLLDSHNPSQSKSNFKSKNFKENVNTEHEHNKNRAIALEILRTYQEEISQNKKEEEEEISASTASGFSQNQNENSNEYSSTCDAIKSYEIEELEPAFDKMNVSSVSTADDIKDDEDDLESSSSDIFYVPKKRVPEKDLDEAVPNFACDTRVFLMDFPKHAVKFGQKIKPFQLPRNLKVDSVISIYVTEIHNPYRFWFHISTDCYLLDDLMNNIELFYQQYQLEWHHIMLSEHMQAGQVCAAVFNGLWHRAEILEKYVIDNKIKVYFMDYGTVAYVDVKKIKYLPLTFAELPAFAFRGSLSDINPTLLHWSMESSLAFLNMSSERLLHAKVVEIDTLNKVLYMLLCDTHEGKAVQINRELISMKHAVKSSEWAKCKQLKKSRMRHKREDYPTFEMLEKGEYPTLAEISDMESKGINYETMTDKMIYYPRILNFEKNTSYLLRDLPYLLLANNPFASDIIEELKEKQKASSSTSSSSQKNKK